jgi:hypothetical protein
MLFIACLLLFSFSATPYSRTVNYLLVSARLLGIAVLSGLTLRAWWTNRDGQILSRLRRWYHDEKTDSRAQ